LAYCLAFIFPHLNVNFIVADGLLVEAESVAEIGLCLVCNFEAVDALLLEPLAGEEVEDVLDVFDAVDVTIDIDIAVIGVDGADKLRVCEAETSVAFYWANVLFLGHYIIQDVAIVEGEEVARLACLKVNHCPNAAGIAKRRAVSTVDGEVTVGEIPHNALHPRPNLAMLMLLGHFHHFYAKAREHPCVLRLIERTDAPAAPLRMVACSVKHVITKHTKEDAACEIYMKGLNVERVAIY